MKDKLNMADIKSSWEIAQQKLQRLGDLSLEEQEKQREEKYAGIAKAIVLRYIANFNNRFLEKEIAQYGEDDKHQIVPRVLNDFIDGITIEGVEENIKRLNGIAVLMHETDMGKNVDIIQRLFDDYSAQISSEEAVIQAEGMKKLSQYSISGTAIESINAASTSLWKQRLDTITLIYQAKLEMIKSEMRKSVLQ